MLLLALLVCGCARISYVSPHGEKFSRTSLGTKLAVQSLSVEVGTNGIRRVTLKGYSNDQVEALGVIAEHAVSAAIKAAK